VLFVGNSLTSANDLPGRCERLARAAGVALTTRAVTADGASLLDHWDAGRVQPAIASRSWRAVVLQQGPSTLPASREELTRLTAQLGVGIRAVGAQPALLMIWPLPGQTAEAVAASYRSAAEATGSLLIPAGEAWVRARALDPSLALTGSDGYHPSPLGTEIAALTVVCTLYPAARPQPQVGSASQQRAMLQAACGR
jgi:hypothetical protein